MLNLENRAAICRGLSYCCPTYYILQQYRVEPYQVVTYICPLTPITPHTVNSPAIFRRDVPIHILSAVHYSSSVRYTVAEIPGWDMQVAARKLEHTRAAQ